MCGVDGTKNGLTPQVLAAVNPLSLTETEWSRPSLIRGRGLNTHATTMVGLGIAPLSLTQRERVQLHCSTQSMCLQLRARTRVLRDRDCATRVFTSTK